MSFDTINQANFYYQLHGFKYIQTPWLVKDEISNITKPEDKKNFYINDDVLVASGEQSFLQIILEGEIQPGKYCTTTPCFRDETEDILHKRYFMKTELIIWDYKENNSITEEELLNMTELATSFFEKYLPVKCVKTNIGYDILDTNSNVELGSYGIREYENIRWMYGTGCAEPRFSHVYQLHKKNGYHNSIIPKYNIGDIGKIFEEVDELKDAVLTKNPIMALVELSDLIGAIEFYLKSEHPKLTLDDLIKMNKITQRSFTNGRRK